MELLRYNQGTLEEGIVVKKVENPLLMDIPTGTGSIVVGNSVLDPGS